MAPASPPSVLARSQIHMPLPVRAATWEVHGAGAVTGGRDVTRTAGCHIGGAAGSGGGGGRGGRGGRGHCGGGQREWVRQPPWWPRRSWCRSHERRSRRVGRSARATRG